MKMLLVNTFAGHVPMRTIALAQVLAETQGTMQAALFLRSLGISCAAARAILL
jgi:hypothetical protein